MEPADRVLAFVAAYTAAHAEAKEAFGDSVDFQVWRERVEGLDQEHFVPGCGMELAMSFGTPPRHAASEAVLEVEPIDEKRCVVITHATSSFLPRWFEYKLGKLGDQWRIVKISEHLDPPNAPFVPDEKRGALLDPPSKPLREVQEGIVVDDAKLFAPGPVEVNGHATTVAVRDVGTIDVPSGVLVTGDFGYDCDLLEPLCVRVPPGSYPVQVSVALGRNAAVRIRFSDAPVMAWHPADSPGGGHVVGVDAANVSVIDASCVVTLSVRRKSDLYDRWAYAQDHPVTQRLRIDGQNAGVIASSGWGDGAYPLYWGLDAQGNPAVLLVDFLVLPRT